MIQSFSFFSRAYTLYPDKHRRHNSRKKWRTYCCLKASMNLCLPPLSMRFRRRQKKNTRKRKRVKLLAQRRRRKK